MDKYKVYPYRWIILLCMIPALAITNVFWLSFAPVTSTAAAFYKVSQINIAFLSMTYMIVYIFMALPASWLVDTKGFRVSMGVGTVITAVFGLVRGLFAADFTVVAVAQVGIAMGQPFLVNSITKVAARWFPVNERATASGIATMAGYVGMILAMVLTPVFCDNYGIEKTLVIYGYSAVVCAAIFLVFSKEYPKTPPGPGEELVNKLSLNDVGWLVRKKDMKLLMICMFIILGIFNALMTWMEDMLKPRGITPEQAGLIGGILVIAGLVGAVVLPAISDSTKKRKPFLFWPTAIAIPLFAGFAFCPHYVLLLFLAAVTGFFVMGMGPIAFQYGAEIAYPVPEGTSFGLLMLMGQVSGIMFIYFMDLLRSPATGDMTIPMVILIVLMLGALVLIARLGESELIKGTDSDGSSLIDSELQK